ncbi:MAG TPA: biotin--[acetyl-CoA-carboxylase] ligase [Acidimicrobiales bacterium]|nr:biotin--[acetyl-CoA-carboxylase] ligase [Acidimicrobiales bacterium]
MSAPGFDVRRFAQIDSTNRYLLDEARAGAPEGVVAVADVQHAGRGRLGRRWEAPAGTGLLASVLLRPVLGPDELFAATALVALAAADACCLTVGVAPAVKWPNDLVVDDAKLAGVLAEVDAAAPGGPLGSVAVVVGIGLNLTWPGPAGAGGTSLLAEAGRAPGRDDLLDALLAGLAERRRQLDGPAGRLAIRDDLAARCATLGRRVRVETAAGEVTGRARGLSETGQLLVEADDGLTSVITAGDVVHLRPAGPDAAPGPPPGGRRRAL